MHIHNLSENNSILNTFLYEIRSLSLQKDRMRFRTNIERIGQLLSYELSKTLTFSSATATTPLGTKEMVIPQDDLVICSILRAGLPLHQGVLNYFDKADNAFISAYRKHRAGSDDFDIRVEYVSCPSLDNKTLVLVDPMIATGQSLALTYKALLKFGTPKMIHVVGVIGAQTGIDYIKELFPETSHVWMAAIDPVLNDKGYIVPGLGDAGDLAYGTKLQQ